MDLARRSLALLTTLVVAASIGAGAASAADVPTGPTFGPTTDLTALHATIGAPTLDYTVIDWAGPNRQRVVQRYAIDPMPEWYTSDRTPARLLLGDGAPRALTGGMVELRPHVANPDGGSLVDLHLLGMVWPFVARQRAGQSILHEVATPSGTQLRGTIPLAENDCAALKAGTRTVFLDPATLVPSKVIERRTGERTSIQVVSHRAGRANDLVALRMRGKVRRQDTGFVRRGAAAAAAAVEFPVVLPTSLPAGFKLTGIGTAPHGATLGPEGSFPRSNGVYEATWSRGLQHIDLTVRPARASLASDWDESDPFGGECEHVDQQSVTIGARTGTYASGEYGPARMWWRDGTTLLTLSGPFGPTELAAIGASLQAVDG